MNKYEATFILYSEDERFKKGLDSVKAELSKIGAKIQKEEDLGIRELAYLIKKESRGHYFYFELGAEPAGVGSIDKNLNLNIDLLKYLFVRK